MASVAYLTKSFRRYLLRRYHACQNCGAETPIPIERKYLVTALNRCGRCGLLYRTPVDTEADNEVYYNGQYSAGFTTDLPDDAALARMVATNFTGTEKDYTSYIDVLGWLGAGPHLFDYGCSWGYGSYQLGHAGYNVLACEIDRRRAAFAAEKLSVALVESPDLMVRSGHPLFESFDVFFSAHVLEHLPAPGKVLDLAWRLLRDGGLFLSFTPNGCTACRKAVPTWSKSWGERHPNSIDDVYLNRAFARSPRLFASSPVAIGNGPSPLLNGSPDALYFGDLSRIELVFAARKNTAACGW